MVAQNGSLRSGRLSCRRISPLMKKFAGVRRNGRYRMRNTLVVVGQVTTLGVATSVATATTHVGFNIGRNQRTLVDLELLRSNKNSSWDIIASPRLLASHLQPASIKQGAKFHIRFPAGKVARRRWNLKRPVLGWRSRPRCYKKVASG